MYFNTHKRGEKVLKKLTIKIDIIDFPVKKIIIIKVFQSKIVFKKKKKNLQDFANQYLNAAPSQKKKKKKKIEC